MTEKTQKEYGLWQSPITPEMLSGAVRLNDVQWARGGETLVWSQSFGGQTTLYAKLPNKTAYPLTTETNKPGGGIAYGGGEFFAAEDLVVFSDKNGRLYLKSYDDEPAFPLTPGFGASACPVLSHNKSFVVYAHSYDGKDLLAATKVDGLSWPVILEQGADFYLNPTLSPDDRHLAWIEWNHPNMPWDGTSLKLARLDPKTLTLSDIQTVDGFGKYACYQACFSPCGNYLAWLINTDELDDLILLDIKSGKKVTLFSQKSLIQPAWIAGQHTLAWAPDSLAIYFIENELGKLSLKKLDLLNLNKPENKLETVQLGDFTYLDQIAISNKNKIAFIGESYYQAAQILTQDDEGLKTIRQSQSEELPKEWFPKPMAFSWQGSDGANVHGLYYPPTNPNFTAIGAPPVITMVHGGPTAAEYDSFDMTNAFFTSRGYAVFRVNYRGSTGYGKSYRDALRGNWGIVDLQDCLEGTQTLVHAGMADPERLVIMGGSAGGFTVLNALIHHPGFFKLGISRYGVSNLFMLEEDTHKFESHYNTSLLGSLPEYHEQWQARSPIFHANQIKDALLIFQGSVDPVVPQSQSDSLVEQLQANNVPHLYRVYEGEGHGFRQAENIVDYYKTIISYLTSILAPTQQEE